MNGRYEREYTAEEILDRAMPRRRPSPTVPFEWDEAGFAFDRLATVPPPGQHPRLFFGPDDLPRIRRRLADTESGRQMLSYVRKQLARGVDCPGTWEYTLFEALSRGDMVTFARLYRPVQNAPVPPPGNAAPPPSQARLGTSWHHRDPFLVGLMLKAFCCLLDVDAPGGARLARALTGYARYIEPLVEAAGRRHEGEAYWRSVRRVVGDHAELGYAYDWAFGFLNAGQAAQVRRVLARITAGRYVLGMNLPPHWRNWNWIGIGLYFVLLALAIEDEEGYDPRVPARGAEVARDFLTYGIDARGVSAESVGYHTAGMTHLTAAMLALAPRGTNLFLHPHYRRQLDQWLVWTLQPQGGEWISDGDLGTFPPSLETMMAAKHFFPDDPYVDIVFQNLAPVRANDYGGDHFLDLLLLCPADPRRGPDGRLVDYRAGAALGLADTFHDPERGLLIARSSWDAEALSLNVTCRCDTAMASHDHADRGRFTLSALGRVWAREDRRLTDSGSHSVVVIDGVGQGYFPPAGRWLGVDDMPAATFAACDAKYAYDWRWAKEITTWDPSDPRLREPYYAGYRDKLLSPDERLRAERDPSPHVAAYYEGFLDGNPLMWDEDSWVVRLRHNPVRYAFRTAGLVRGPRPYVLILDDIRKDDAPHRYHWQLQVPDDVLLLALSARGNQTDILLGERTGTRRLLVRVLQNTTDARDAPFLETYDAGGLRPQRLIVPSVTIAARFKVLLYPHHADQPLPTTDWSGHASELTIRWPDQADTFAFTNDDAGQTHLSHQRTVTPTSTL